MKKRWWWLWKKDFRTADISRKAIFLRCVEAFKATEKQRPHNRKNVVELVQTIDRKVAKRKRERERRQEWEKSGKRRKKKEKEGERKERRDISYVLIKLARNRATTRSTSWIFYEGYHERATAPYTILSPTCNPSSPFHLSIFSSGHACNSRFFLYRPVEEAEEDTRCKKQSDLFCMWITGSGTF